MSKFGVLGLGGGLELELGVTGQRRARGVGK